ncbi:unnamed protein product [Dovyalis caffra]|uniref:Uncharacterized protein n=1 Tax=Dovyalis caffra TaxID=77055 RepID=A0AAV1QSH8_9ROSI|nr:unnamed protein product [Dovyalis caffra]
MSGGGKGIVQKSSACLTMGFATTICTDLARKTVSQDDPFGLHIAELEETIRAIEDCKTAGVTVKLISEDDVPVVRAAAIEFGMLTENSEASVLKGKDFQNCTEEERIGMVDQITAIGNCLQSDKLLLVQCLRKKGNMVALIGANNLHDNPALIQAEIGFVKAEWGTKMARDYLDLMLWDGREALMTPIQLSWTKLIVPILGSVAVITEPSGEKTNEQASSSENRTTYDQGQVEKHHSSSYLSGCDFSDLPIQRTGDLRHESETRESHDVQ